MIVGQYKVQYAEDTFLHFAGISAAADQDHLAGKVHDSEVALTGTIGSRIGQEAGRLQNKPIGILGFDLFLGRTQEQVVAEQVGPGGFVHHADVQAILGIGTGISIAYPYFFSG